MKMKQLIRNLENEYIVILMLAFGALLALFPTQFTKAVPWALGTAMTARGLLVIILAFYYKDESHKPGRALLYLVMGITIIVLGHESIKIIGVIWAVFTLEELSNEISEKWVEKEFSPIFIGTVILSVILAVTLMIHPYEHFSVHVRSLGVQIMSSCLIRGLDVLKVNHPGLASKIPFKL